MAKKSSRNAANNSVPLMLIGAGAVIIIAVLIWQVLSTPSQNASTTANNNVPYSNVARVSLAEAKTALDQKTAIFVDVRDAQFFLDGHIPAAINIPGDEFNARYGQLDPQQWIITYCT